MHVLCSSVLHTHSKVQIAYIVDTYKVENYADTPGAFIVDKSQQIMNVKILRDMDMVLNIVSVCWSG